jgi:hypothetical protein
MTMPKRIKALIVSAVVLAALLVKISLPAAQASTTECGSPCFSLSVQEDGTSEDLTVTGSAADGYSVGMATASTTNTGQDFTLESYGDVGNSNIEESGVVPAKLLLNYSGDTLVEFQYAPGGAPSDQCLSNGLSESAADAGVTASLTVTLNQCGLSDQTLWILDGSGTDDYIDLISAGYSGSISYGGSNALDGQSMLSGTGMFAEPAVLTLGSKGVDLNFLSEIGGTVSNTQMWTGFSGA